MIVFVKIKLNKKILVFEILNVSKVKADLILAKMRKYVPNHNFSRP